jgi:hypothetical protein
VSLTLIGSRLSFDFQERTGNFDFLMVLFSKCDINFARKNIPNVFSNRHLEFSGNPNKSDLRIYRTDHIYRICHSYRTDTPYRPLSGRMFTFKMKAQEYNEFPIINKGIGKEKLRKLESNEIDG